MVLLLNSWLSKIAEFRECQVGQQRSSEEGELVTRGGSWLEIGVPRMSIAGLQWREEKDHSGGERKKERERECVCVCVK